MSEQQLQQIIDHHYPAILAICNCVTDEERHKDYLSEGGDAYSETQKLAAQLNADRSVIEQAVWACLSDADNVNRREDELQYGHLNQDGEFPSAGD